MSLTGLEKFLSGLSLNTNKSQIPQQGTKDFSLTSSTLSDLLMCTTPPPTSSLSPSKLQPYTTNYKLS